MKIIPGDITKASEAYVCHQCNCVTNRAAHLAATMFAAFPWANIYAERSDWTDPNKAFAKPGTIEIRGNGKDQRYVIAMLAQFYPGRPRFSDSAKDGFEARKRYFSSCLDRMLEIPGLQSVAFPFQIGCGAAGGDWGVYQNMIEEFAKRTKASVVCYRLQE
jgi:O-acetyl-ADP-ribose deacetylase (regulator of RNase III)